MSKTIVLAVAALVVCLLSGNVCVAQSSDIEAMKNRSYAIALQDIVDETNVDKKLALLHEFELDHPYEEGVKELYEDIFSTYAEAKRWDKVFELGEKLLNLDSTEIDTAQQCLVAAEARKDPALIETWSQRTLETAAKALASPAPKDPEQLEDWKTKIQFSKEAVKYVNYVVFDQVKSITDPKKQIGAIEDFLKRYPDTPYKHQLRAAYYADYKRLDPGKAADLAEQELKDDPNNLEFLYQVFNRYLQAKNTEQILAYSARVLEAVNKAQKPEDMSDTDWEKNKSFLALTANWNSGNIQLQREHYAQADKHLRAVLPMIRGDEKMTATVLFYLGWSNYKLHRISDSVKFNRQCMALNSPYREQAAKNIDVALMEATAK